MKNLQKCALGFVALALLGMASCSECGSDCNTNDSVKTGDTHAVINGEQVNEPMYNAVVSIYNKTTDTSMCTGTLIHPQWVLTAASCGYEEEPGRGQSFTNGEYVIAFGNNPRDLTKDDVVVNGVHRRNQYKIAGIYTPDEFGMNEFGVYANDIMLIKLDEPVEEDFARPIKPITPNEALTRSMLYEGFATATYFKYIGFGFDEEGYVGYKLANNFDVKYTHSSYCGAANSDNINGCLYGTVHVEGCHPDKSWCDMPGYAEYCETGSLCVNRDENVMIPYGSLYFEGGSEFFGETHGLGCDGDVGGPALMKWGESVYNWNENTGFVVAGVESYSDITCSTYSVYTAVQDFYDSFILKYAPEVDSYWAEKGCTDGDTKVNPENGNLYVCNSGEWNEAECLNGESYYHNLEQIDYICMDGTMVACPMDTHAKNGQCVENLECMEGQELIEEDGNSYCSSSGSWLVCPPGQIMYRRGYCKVPDMNCEEAGMKFEDGYCVADSWVVCPKDQSYQEGECVEDPECELGDERYGKDYDYVCIMGRWHQCPEGYSASGSGDGVCQLNDY